MAIALNFTPSATQRVCGIEVELQKTSTGYVVCTEQDGKPVHIGEVHRVQRAGETMWQAEGSKRFRTVMPQAVEELLIRAEILDGIGW